MDGSLGVCLGWQSWGFVLDGSLGVCLGWQSWGFVLDGSIGALSWMAVLGFVLDGSLGALSWMAILSVLSNLLSCKCNLVEYPLTVDRASGQACHGARPAQCVGE